MPHRVRVMDVAVLLVGTGLSLSALIFPIYKFGMPNAGLSRPDELAFFLPIILFYFLMFVVAIVFLIKKHFARSFIYFVPLFLFGLMLMSRNENSFDFPEMSHGKIASIYKSPEFELSNKEKQDMGNGRRLVNLSGDCDPPDECSCWLLLDPERTGVALSDVALEWHEPRTPIFRRSQEPSAFRIISVQKIDLQTYSVIGCGYDWSAFKPL